MTTKTRVTWWIRDGAATLEGSDVVPGQHSKEMAEQLLDEATARVDKDLRTLPKFCAAYYGCEDATDWGIVSAEPE